MRPAAVDADHAITGLAELMGVGRRNQHLATQPQLSESPPITRKYVRIGASPRGAQALTIAGRINSLLAGRYNLSYDDVRKVMRENAKSLVAR